MTASVHRAGYQPAMLASKRRAVWSIAPVVLFVATILIVFVWWPSSRDNAGVPAKTGAHSQARALLLLDGSGSMGDPFPSESDRLCDHRPPCSKLEVARSFLETGVAQNVAYDRLGIWVVTTTPDLVPDCTSVRRKVYCELQPLSDANRGRKAITTKLQTANLEPHGGTPLYPAIALAVDATVADSTAGEADATNLVIALTDGGELRDLDSAILGTKANRGVKVFVTALTSELCAHIRPDLRRYFHPASNCLTVENGDQAERAQKYIREHR